jgi:ABC-2 type transport system permease protein
MRNAWLIVKREYLELIRTKSFVISTIMFALVMAAIMLLPAKLAALRRPGTQHVVIVTPNHDFGEAVRAQLTANAGGIICNIEIDPNLTENKRSQLRDKVSAGEIDGYLWLPEDTLAAHKGSFSTQHASDFVETEILTSGVRFAAISEELRKHGVSAAQTNEIFGGTYSALRERVPSARTDVPGPQPLSDLLDDAPMGENDPVPRHR